MPGTFGRCIPMGDCYFFKHTIDINNCWMVAPKANLTSQLNLTLELDVLNMAMKSSTKKEQVTFIQKKRILSGNEKVIDLWFYFSSLIMFK